MIADSWIDIEQFRLPEAALKKYAGTIERKVGNA